MRARRFLLHGLLALLVATGASGMGAYAQTPPADGVRMPVTLPDSEVWRIRSEGSGLEYQIMVAWPDYPPPENGYRVIYVLDANAMFLTTVETVRSYQRRPDIASDPGALVVGIGYPPGSDILARRTWDLTMPVDEKRSRAPTGGAKEFFGFIQDVLKPRIERDYKVDRNRQTLMGHSLAGMFTTRAMTRHPEAFESFIGISSSFWFGGHGLSAEVEHFARSRKPGDPVVRVMLLAGEHEEKVHPRAWARHRGRAAKERADLGKRGQVSRARAAASHLAASPGMVVDLAEILGEDHGSVVPSAISRAVNFVIRGPHSVPAVPSGREYLAMTAEQRYQLRLEVRALPDTHRIPWLDQLKRNLRDGLPKADIDRLHIEHASMDERHGIRPHGVDAD